MLLESQTAAVEVETERSATRQVLHVRDRDSAAAVALDPIELEGLTKSPEAGLEAPLDAPAELWLLQNEFAMVEVGPVITARGGCLLIRDLASRVEVCLDADALRGLTALAHHAFAPLLDPSRLVQSDEPDPDQI